MEVRDFFSHEERFIIDTNKGALFNSWIKNISLLAYYNVKGVSGRFINTGIAVLLQNVNFVQM